MRVKEPGWAYRGRCTEGQAIDIRGLNPWGHTWRRRRGAITVFDVDRSGREFNVPIFVIGPDDHQIPFAAVELSMQVWGFWEPHTDEAHAWVVSLSVS